ncbi:transketolase C-terminal domain-containing protein [Paenibacillus validus]|uniref:transketolase family protein n=2 Tax=Paenibacillus validus TaxID=44253 RepID=UPI000FD8305C|nr:transketolase C-terminal domain-containing protein [Paenibacillus validus]MED4601269.1 transketolase C-terminal domain-containing protein [Paenibacillus validus]MED4605781.1 transketolase C-terminal domain-containing protein [Paenibacillus validus]
MRTTFLDTLMQQARIDDRIYLITPDLGFSVLEKFRDEFPKRFLNAGIAEQNAVGVASGLALSGKIVYVYSIVPFVTMRCFEQIRIDVAYMNTNVRLVGVGAGLSYGPQGATHHAIEDIAIMRALPNMTVCAPGDPLEVRELTNASFYHQGPMYIRLGKNNEPQIHSPGTKISLGKAIEVTKGDDLVLITTSNTLELGLKWVKEWDEQNVKVRLISMPTVKPIDVEMINKIIEEGLPILTLEEHNIVGGLGSAVAEVVAESEKKIKFKRIGLPDVYSHYVGSQDFLREKLGLVRPSI